MCETNAIICFHAVHPGDYSIPDHRFHTLLWIYKTFHCSRDLPRERESACLDHWWQRSAAVDDEKVDNCCSYWRELDNEKWEFRWDYRFSRWERSEISRGLLQWRGLEVFYCWGRWVDWRWFRFKSLYDNAGCRWNRQWQVRIKQLKDLGLKEEQDRHLSRSDQEKDSLTVPCFNQWGGGGGRDFGKDCKSDRAPH